ncbi:MAG: hypothetical protein LBR61_08855 [Synergistaceae bacterium]|nr:hypothetical protein [Synergistaceae bacterium]
MAKREIRQIFDLLLKRLLHLSRAATVQFINGLFGTSHPADSGVEYPNTESVSRNLRKRQSDMLVVIDGRTYHLEAQIRDDENIALRVFEYGWREALRTKRASEDGWNFSLKFPRAKVIAWETTGKTPDAAVLTLEFSDGGRYDYQVEIFKFPDHDIEELEEKKLWLLLPFCLLKFRKRVTAARTSERRRELAVGTMELLNEMDAVVDRAIRSDLLSAADAGTVLEYAQDLFEELYGGYSEFKEADDMFKEKAQTRSQIAARRGREEGLEEGIERGIEKGREEGLEVGIEKGMEKVARNMLARGGFAPDTVAELTGLPPERIRELAQ